MNAEGRRSQRLYKLLELARVYRGWSQAQLAQALGRDPSKLYPDTANPKLDFVMALGDALEWSVDTVVDYLAHDGPSEPASAGTRADFEALDAEAMAAYRRGESERLTQLARRMYEVAQTPEQRALACNREFGGWDGQGRYVKAMEATRRGLQHWPIPTGLRFMLQVNLANTYYTLWELASAHGIAHALVGWFERNPPGERLNRGTHAFAYYVRGHTSRRMMSMEPDQRAEHARAARSDLETAVRLHSALAADFDDPYFPAVARTCQGGLIEVGVELGFREAQRGVDEILEGLNVIADLNAVPGGDWLESYGWWCIFGGNIALRHLSGRALQQALAVFSNKALEIADRLNNWALRERAFTMQYAGHQNLADATGLDLDYVIDDEDRRLITGAMGRFPMFRDIGWQILQTGKLIAERRGGWRHG